MSEFGEVLARRAEDLAAMTAARDEPGDLPVCFGPLDEHGCTACGRFS